MSVFRKITLVVIGGLFISWPSISWAAGETIWIIETGAESTMISLLEDDYSITSKTTDEIVAGVPEEVDLLIYPGGLLPITQAQDSDLRQAIKDYVEVGGSFFGSCGGSITGAQQLTYDYGVLEMIGLVQVQAIDYLSWANTVSYTDGFVFSDNAEINGEYAGTTNWLQYTGGPAFEVVSGQEDQVEILATFAEDFDAAETTHPEVEGKAAIVMADYGLGKVILSAPHPETNADTRFIFNNIIEWLLAEPDYTPDQVTNVRVPDKYKKARQVKIRWDKQVGMSGYVLKLYKRSGDLLRTIKINENINYRDLRKLTPETRYKVKVRAKRTVEEAVYRGPWSDYKFFKTVAD